MGVSAKKMLAGQSVRYLCPLPPSQFMYFTSAAMVEYIHVGGILCSNKSNVSSLFKKCIAARNMPSWLGFRRHIICRLLVSLRIGLSSIRRPKFKLLSLVVAKYGCLNNSPVSQMLQEHVLLFPQLCDFTVSHVLGQQIFNM